MLLNRSRVSPRASFKFCKARRREGKDLFLKVTRFLFPLPYNREKFLKTANARTEAREGENYATEKDDDCFLPKGCIPNKATGADTHKEKSTDAASKTKKSFEFENLEQETKLRALRLSPPCAWRGSWGPSIYKECHENGGVVAWLSQAISGMTAGNAALLLLLLLGGNPS